METGMSRLRRLLIGVACVYLLGLGILFVMQRSLVFPALGGYLTLAQANAPAAMQEIDITTDDGLALKAWYAPATSRHQTIVMFHGNAETLATLLAQARPFIAVGYGVLLAEYRGYFGMPGAPSETGLYADARANLRALASRGITPTQTVLMGHSLGTGVATRMAQETPVAGVILSAPYTSIMGVAADRYPIFPVRALMLDRFENVAGVKNMRAPLLIIHGDQDQIIPVSHGEAVFAAALEPKTLKILQGAGHNDMRSFGSSEAALAWLDTTFKN